ncbi:MAG: ABC transporter ATP-binding protein [Thermoproteota archaeon]|jgi:putative ABC transport system ATP-binding protein|nr:ABC transporter ATP-binding protein [Thermoproteota archaeon]
MKGVSVNVKNLVKIYKTGSIEVQALRGVDLEVEAGEFISIIGPSGSGKTTLLNIIGGLDYPTGGYVKVGEIIVSNLSARQLVEYRKKYVGFVFQFFNLIPELNVEENIELPMIALGINKKKRMETIESLLDILGIKNKRYNFPHELSGGEQQRVAIAIALANDPPLLLADEPTGELDSYNAKILINYFARINSELGKTVIVVTHDPNVASATNRIYKLEDGMIKGSFLPSSLASDANVKYSDILKRRITEIEEAIKKLDIEFKEGKISPDKFAEERIRLQQKKQTLKEELAHLGLTS